MSIIDEVPDFARLQIADFVSSALNVPESRDEIATSIEMVREDEQAGIYMLTLASPEIGDASFLVYRYDLSNDDSEESPGQDQFQTDLQTLVTSADLELPGPRILAHATTAETALILATSPETYRKLTGESDSAEETTANLSPEERERLRRDAALALLLALKEANKHATTWIGALGDSEVTTADSNHRGVPMLEEESALALHVADGANVQDLLHALNLFVSWAGQYAENTPAPIATDNGSESATNR